MHGIMMRLSLIAAVVGVTLIFSAPLMAQDNYGIYAPGFYVPGYYGPAIETPEVQLGSMNTPSIVKVPPVVMATPLPSYAQPAEFPETAYMPPPPPAGIIPMRFDYLISPVAYMFPGSMADDSISLGEYARELRSQKHGPPPVVLTPDAKISPAE